MNQFSHLLNLINIMKIEIKRGQLLSMNRKQQSGFQIDLKIQHKIHKMFQSH